MTILDLLEDAPDALALDDLRVRRSRADLIDRALRVAGVYGASGVEPGGHVAVLMGNRAEFVECCLGGLFGGVWVTPINWHLTGPEVEYVLADSGTRLVVTDPEHEEIARAGAGELPVLVAGPVLDDALRAVEPVPVRLDARPGGNMFYTSGTTGRPKGVRRTPQPTLGAALEALPAAGARLGLDGAGPHLVTGPLHHAAPLGFAVMDQHAGAAVVLMPRFDAETCLDLLADRTVRHTHLVPTMFVRLLRLPPERRESFDASALTLVLHGAAPVARDVKRQMIEWWGPSLVEYWGASEGGVVTLATTEEWLTHPGTVGRPIGGHEVWAEDDEGRRVGPGIDGLLWCRNAAASSVFSYHRDDGKTAAAHRLDGVYTLGDIGRVDHEGFVHLADRASHMIISGGVNIYPAEIEHALQLHPAVGDAAVFGIPDAEWGEQVVAAVELVEEASASDALATDIRAWLRQRLASYKVPRQVLFHDRLPRQDSGKLYKQRLREPYWADQERRI